MAGGADPGRLALSPRAEAPMALPPNQRRPPAAEPERQAGPADLTPQGDGDRWVATLCYALASFPAPLFAFVTYFVNRKLPGYRRFHAQQAVAMGVIVILVELVMSFFVGDFELDNPPRPILVVGAVALAVELSSAYRVYAADGPVVIPVVTPLARRLFPNFPTDDELGLPSKP